MLLGAYWFLGKRKKRRGFVFYKITKIKKTKPFTVFFTSGTPSALTFTVIITLPKPRTGALTDAKGDRSKTPSLLLLKKTITIKTQRRAQRGTKYHAAPIKTAQPAPNAVRAAPQGMILFVIHSI